MTAIVRIKRYSQEHGRVKKSRERTEQNRYNKTQVNIFSKEFFELAKDKQSILEKS